MFAKLSRFLALMLAGIMLVPSHPVADGTGQRTAEEVRGLWVLRSSLTSPDAIAELIRVATDTGYNTLLVQVRSRGDAYYASDVDPRADSLRGQQSSFDPLATVLDAAHAAGLKVHAWVNVNLVSSAAPPAQSAEHIITRRPEWLMVPRALATELARVEPRSPGYLRRLAGWTRARNDTVEGLYLSPIPVGAQDYTVSVVTNLMRSYPLDGAHLDYIRYPSSDFDYSRAALTLFRESLLPTISTSERDRLDRAARTNPASWTNQFPEAWAAFRRDRLTALVRRIRAAVKAARPDAILSSAVVPDPVRARDHHFQDWQSWAAERTLDVVCPMAYATTLRDFSAQVAASTASLDVAVWMGIGAWRLPVAQTASHLAAARRAGVAGVLLFSYDSLLTTGSPRGVYFTRLRAALTGSNQDRRR